MTAASNDDWAGPARVRAAVEWPSLLLACVIYGGWLALTLSHAALPLWIFVPLGAWFVAWHGSLQHEILHGHPMRSRLFNRCLASVPLSLWLPYESYRVSHLRHHRDERLTDPLDDPESRYVTAEDWTRLSRPARFLLRQQKTLLGRLTIGPFWTIGQFLSDEAAALWRGDTVTRRAWAQHLPALALVLFWLVFVCEINLLTYIFGLVYPAASLMLLRSFAEHKAAHGVTERTAIVENAPILGLLYLHNNLHAAHHERPCLPWYEIPAWYRGQRERFIRENGGMVYDGYLDLARRYLVTAHDAVEHPLGRAPERGLDLSPAPSAGPPASA